jgi:hypothetical protein
MLVPLQEKQFICLYGGKRDAFDFNPPCDDKIHFGDRWRWDAQKQRKLVNRALRRARPVIKSLPKGRDIYGD